MSLAAGISAGIFSGRSSALVGVTPSGWDLFWRYYWLIWLAVVFATFLPPELYAAIVNNHHTLSETMWHWAGVDLAHPWRFWTWIWPHWLLAGFMTWLNLHLVFGLIR